MSTIKTVRGLLAFALVLLLACAAGAQEPRQILRDRMIEAALNQVGVTIHYDGSYQTLAYPGGDVPLDRGVCTDVLIRAFREIGVDLQVLVHEDMSTHFDEYPRDWGLRAPDRNIDHRRVLNLMCLFARRGCDLPVTRNPDDYRPGDIVAWELFPGVYHIGIVSNQPSCELDRLLIVHNVGLGTELEDFLFAYEIKGHYRFF